MGKKATALIKGGPVTVLGLLWEAYSQFTTVRDLPEDAGGFAKMLADPPIYLPWLVVAIGIAVFAWFAWKGGDAPPESPGVTQSSSGPNSPNSVQYGDTHNTYNNYAPTQAANGEAGMPGDGEKPRGGSNKVGDVRAPLTAPEYSQPTAIISFKGVEISGNGGAGVGLSGSVRLDAEDTKIRDNKGGGVVWDGKEVGSGDDQPK